MERTKHNSIPWESTEYYKIQALHSKKVSFNAQGEEEVEMNSLIDGHIQNSTQTYLSTK